MGCFNDSIKIDEIKHDKIVCVNTPPKAIVKYPTEEEIREKFRKEAWEKLNSLRKIHFAVPLHVSDDLNKIAQNHAENIAKSGKFFYSQDRYKSGILGENLYRSKDRSNSGAEMIEFWYKEKNAFDFAENKYKVECRNFTQMIWKGSEEVGFGCAKCDDGRYVGVANYYPSGNIMFDFENNVQDVRREKEDKEGKEGGGVVDKCEKDSVDGKINKDVNLNTGKNNVGVDSVNKGNIVSNDSDIDDKSFSGEAPKLNNNVQINLIAELNNNKDDNINIINNNSNICNNNNSFANSNLNPILNIN